MVIVGKVTFTSEKRQSI